MTPSSALLVKADKDKGMVEELNLKTELSILSCIQQKATGYREIKLILINCILN